MKPQTSHLGIAQGDDETRKGDVLVGTSTATRSQQHGDVTESFGGDSSSATGQDKTVRRLRVAIVHDWLVGGGAENVVLELHHMYPEAPIYTSFCTDEWREKLDGKVVTGFLQYWPFSKLRKFLPVLRIWWFTHLDFRGFDVVISSSGNGEAKGIRVPEGVKHICYCHSPTHFYWRHYEQYMKSPGFGVFNPLARLGLKLLVGPLRKWDLKASKRPDVYIANSNHIKSDIKKFYGRDSTVIHPPVDVERFQNHPDYKRKGFITVGRLVSYKRVDLIIQACNELELPLTVVGRGPEYKNLVKIAGPTIKFVTDASNTDVAKYMASAEAFIFAAEEDFGITPVEAMASGTPVIAFKAGGALDYVIPGKTGEFFTEQSVKSMVETLTGFDHSKYSTNSMIKKAAEFSIYNFRTNLNKLLDGFK